MKTESINASEKGEINNHGLVHQEAITIGIPTTPELIESFVQISDQASLNENSNNSDRPPQWLVEFESLAGSPPFNDAHTKHLLAYADSLPISEERSVIYALIASQVAPSTFQRLLWPKVWDPSTSPDIARIIANTVFNLPEEIMFSYLLALLQYPDKETRAMAQNVLWGYFPDIPESEYPHAIQAHLTR
jgi:hypothetical protein